MHLAVLLTHAGPADHVSQPHQVSLGPWPIKLWQLLQLQWWLQLPCREPATAVMSHGRALAGSLVPWARDKAATVADGAD